MTALRVWAEELEQEESLRLTWGWEEGEPDDRAGERESVHAALAALDGVLSAELDDDGIVIEVDPERVSRPELAAAIRDTLGGSEPGPETAVEQIRVWAEALNMGSLRLTWRMPESLGGGDQVAECRRVAAWLASRPGVTSARIENGGVVIDYEPDQLERQQIGDTVRRALLVEEDLRTRANALVRRAPDYGTLARRLAVDKRVSPLPDAARQMVPKIPKRKELGPEVARQVVLHMIPGGALIGRIRSLVPVVEALSAWSYESSPEIVDEHLAAVGLDRATLEVDAATAHETKLYTSQTASILGDRATSGARRAVKVGRGWLDARKEAPGER